MDPPTWRWAPGRLPPPGHRSRRSERGRARISLSPALTLGGSHPEAGLLEDGVLPVLVSVFTITEREATQRGSEVGLGSQPPSPLRPSAPSPRRSGRSSGREEPAWVHLRGTIAPITEAGSGPKGQWLVTSCLGWCDHVRGAENTVVNEPDKFSRADRPAAESTNNKVAVGGLRGLGHPRRKAGALCPQGPFISLGASRAASSWRRCRLWPSQDWSCPRAKPALGGQGSCRKAGKFPVVTEGLPPLSQGTRMRMGGPGISNYWSCVSESTPLQVASLSPTAGASCGQ